MQKGILGTSSMSACLGPQAPRLFLHNQLQKRQVMMRGTNVLVRKLFNIAKVRAGAGSSAAQPPRELSHLGRGPDAAEELGVIASDCSAVCQRLGELWGFREISLGKPLGLVNSS